MAEESQAAGQLERDLAAAGLDVLRDEPLARHTSLRIGGPADLYVRASTVDGLVSAARLSGKHGVPFLVLGGGTNVLVSERGYRGLVIGNACSSVELERPAGRRGQIRHIDMRELVTVTVYAESGVPLAGLAREMIARGLEGLTWAEGIPGTLGGAIVGNAGAYGGSMADLILEVEWLDPVGKRSWLPAADLGLGYRTSRFKGESNGVVLAARLVMNRQNPTELARLRGEYARRRRASQPAGLSAGSVFKNPPQSFAGRLIEGAGLKGRRAGGAVISEKHANFILNDHHATADDVMALIRQAQEEVYKRFRISLQLELQLVGDFDEGN